MLLYRAGKLLFYLYFKIINRLTIVGKEHFPRQGGVLICSNHISNFDPPLVGTAAPRQVRFMGKAELFSNSFMNWLMTTLGVFPVKRGFNDKQALRNGLRILNGGEVIGLFPEGTRSKSGKLGKGLAGAGFFALRSNAVVVPCAITGSYGFFKKNKVVFGRPIDFQEFKDRKLSANEATEIIMHHIQELLDSEERKI